MSETKLLTVAELASHVGGRLIGDGSIHIERVATSARPSTGEIAYVEDEKFFAAGEVQPGIVPDRAPEILSTPSRT